MAGEEAGGAFVDWGNRGNTLGKSIVRYTIREHIVKIPASFKAKVG